VGDLHTLKSVGAWLKVDAEAAKHAARSRVSEVIDLAVLQVVLAYVLPDVQLSPETQWG